MRTGPTSYLNSRRFRHLNINDGDIRFVFLDQPAGRLAITGFRDHFYISRLLQKLADSSSYNGMIVG